MRRALATAPVAGLVVSAVLFAGCGAEAGVAQAQQACGYVTTSIRLYDRAEHGPGSRSGVLLARATADLETAVPLAAAANIANPIFNPLVTTLQEAGRVDEGHLLTALRAQCAMADSSNPQAPVINNTAPGRSSPSTLPGQ
ncbi:MAG: hypothetical protein ACYCU7_11165 [Acidimicrobiales bacterium]